MKTTPFFLLLFCIQLSSLWAQKTKIDTFIIAHNNELLTFILKQGINADSLFYLHDTVVIQSFENSNQRAIAVRKLFFKADTVQKKNLLYSDSLVRLSSGLADNLYDSYKNRKDISELNSKIALLKNDQGVNIGILSFKRTTISAYLIEKDSLPLSQRQYAKSPSLIPKKAFVVLIDSADISFEDGIIKDIVIRAKSKKNNLKPGYIPGNNPPYDSVFYFSNPGYIPIRNAEDLDNLSEKERNYLSFNYSPHYIAVIDLADVLDYNRKIVFASGTYIPKDTCVTIISGQNKKVQLRKPSISEFFDLSIFSDLLGYGKEKTSSNGIVQAEAQANFILNDGVNSYDLAKTVKTSHKFIKMNLYRRQWISFNRISPYIKLTKLNNTSSKLGIDISDRKNLLDVFKYAYLNVGTELNIATLRTDDKLFTVNTAFGILRTRIGTDSVESKNYSISTVYGNLNSKFKICESNKIDFTLGIGGYIGWSLSSLDSIQIKNIKERVEKYISNKCNYWFEFQQNINLHPGGNRQNSVFIRSSQYYNIASKNNYFTFQIGYSTSLSNLLNF
jgi:hypothetical protein